MVENAHPATVVARSNHADPNADFHTGPNQSPPGIFEIDDPSISNGLNLDESNEAQLEYQYDYIVNDAAFQWDDRIDSIFFNAFGQFDPPIPMLEDDAVLEGIKTVARPAGEAAADSALAHPRDTQQPTPLRDLHQSSRAGQFSLLQMDPAEAKCAEIRELLQIAHVFRNDQDLLQHITREKMLKCHQAYGLHIQPNLPLLHSPTYSFSHTPPMLFLVIMLTGACYTPELLPSDDLSRFALRLSMMISNECVSLCRAQA